MQSTPKVVAPRIRFDEDTNLNRISNWRAAADEAAEFAQHRETKLLLDHWCSLWQAGRPPYRCAIDATEMPAALAHIFLMDYLPQSHRLRYRLAGGEVEGNYDSSLVGRHLDEVVKPEAYLSVAKYFFACPETPAIVILSGRLFDERDKPGLGERMLLPLFAQDGEPEGLIGITCCQNFFASQEEARRSADRIIRTFPLDGRNPA